MYVSLHPDSTWCVVLSHQPTVSLYAGLRQLLKPRDISLQHLLFTLPAAQHGEGVVMWSVMLKKERSRSWQEGQLRNNPCWQKKSGKPYQKFQPLKDKVLKGTVCVSLKVSGSRTRILRSNHPPKFLKLRSLSPLDPSPYNMPHLCTWLAEEKILITFTNKKPVGFIQFAILDVT